MSNSDPDFEKRAAAYVKMMESGKSTAELVAVLLADEVGTDAAEAATAGARLNFNKDGTLDEIAASDASIHLEQMDANRYWLSVMAGGVEHVIWFSARGKITVTHRTEDAVEVADRQARSAVAPDPVPPAVSKE